MALRHEAGITQWAEEYETFEQFYKAYQKWISFHIEVMAEQEKLEYDFAGEVCSLSYLSILYDDCIERGKGIFSGGIRYLGGTLESYGNVNTADSLTAIRKLVFEQKLVGWQELLRTLDADFKGFAMLQKKLKSCPKFGNDQEEADIMMKDLHQFVCLTAKAQAKRIGLDSYLIVVINNSANTTLGLLTGAGADGRNACMPMANANSPQAGGDKNGVTAVLNSMLQIDTDIHAGAVQNIKFSKETFNESRPEAIKVIESYFERGGA